MNTDFTKIDARFDPSKMMMYGRTIHGGMDFNMPFISHIVGNLWVGGCEDGLVLPEGFKHVVSMYPWESYSTPEMLDSELKFKAYDSDVKMMEKDLIWLADHLNRCLDNGKTLIHCQAGLNRSNLVAAFALIIRGENGSPKEVIKLLREKRSPAVLCNFSFEKWLLKQKQGGK